MYANHGNKTGCSLSENVNFFTGGKGKGRADTWSKDRKALGLCGTRPGGFHTVTILKQIFN